MGEDSHPSRRLGQLSHLRSRQPGLGHEAGTVVGQGGGKGVVDGLGRAHRHHGRGKVGTAHAPLVSGLGHHHLVGDGHAESDKSIGQCPVPPSSIGPQADQLLAERAVLVVDEVDQHVHAAGPHRPAGDLTAGHESEAELDGPHPGRPGAGQRVVVGQRHRTASGLGGQLRDPLRRVAAVGHVGVGMEIDHPRPRLTGLLGASSGGRPLGWSGTVRLLCG